MLAFRIIGVLVVVVDSAEGPFNRNYCSPEMSCNNNGATYKHILCAFKRQNNVPPLKGKEETNNTVIQSKTRKCTDYWGEMSPDDRMQILGE